MFNPSRLTLLGLCLIPSGLTVLGFSIWHQLHTFRTDRLLATTEAETSSFGRRERSLAHLPALQASRRSAADSLHRDLRAQNDRFFGLKARESALEKKIRDSDLLIQQLSGLKSELDEERRNIAARLASQKEHLEYYRMSHLVFHATHVVT